MARLLAPVTPKAFSDAVEAEFGADLEAVSLCVEGERQSQAGLFGLNGFLQK